jgi:hypothetical protein
MAIQQVHAIPVIVDGVIGLSHGHGHIISTYLEAVFPHFFPCTWSMTSFFVESWRYLAPKKNGCISVVKLNHHNLPHSTSHEICWIGHTYWIVLGVDVVGLKHLCHSS